MLHTLTKPLPADIGYFSYVPMYDGQSEWGGECPYLQNGKRCYFDGSTLQAEKYYEILLNKGSDGLWEAMERYYTDLFGELT